MMAADSGAPAEVIPATEKTAAQREKGALVYGEGRNKKARRVRLMYMASGILAAVGLIGMAVIVLVATFLVFQLPFYARVIGSLLTGALLYWSFLGIQDIRRLKRALRPLRVFELGIRLPSGTEDDIAHGRPPRFMQFKDIAAFYPNEGKLLRLPYLVVTLNDTEAEPLIISKELFGNWGKFRKAVKERMEVHKSWYFLKDVGSVYGGRVESDDLHLKYGVKERAVELSWDGVAEPPKSKMKGLKNLAVVTVALREGGKLKFLTSLGAADQIARNYQKYVDRFWKEPEEEEERWEKLEETEEKGDKT